MKNLRFTAWLWNRIPLYIKFLVAALFIGTYGLVMDNQVMFIAGGLILFSTMPVQMMADAISRQYEKYIEEQNELINKIKNSHRSSDQF